MFLMKCFFSNTCIVVFEALYCLTHMSKVFIIGYWVIFKTDLFFTIILPRRHLSLIFLKLSWRKLFRNSEYSEINVSTYYCIIRNDSWCAVWCQRNQQIILLLIRKIYMLMVPSGKPWIKVLSLYYVVVYFLIGNFMFLSWTCFCH